MEDGNEVRHRRTELRIRRQANITLRIVQTKSTKPKTSLGCSPSSGYNLTACRQGNAEASKNLLNVESPSAPLDRGCISRKRFLSRKERKEMEGGNEVRYREWNYAFAGTANKTFILRMHIGELARGSPLPHNRVSG